jgi:hypothetical protein
MATSHRSALKPTQPVVFGQRGQGATPQPPHNRQKASFGLRLVLAGHRRGQVRGAVGHQDSGDDASDLR